jgi:hypothetical protein
MEFYYAICSDVLKMIDVYYANANWCITNYGYSDENIAYYNNYPHIDKEKLYRHK